MSAGSRPMYGRQIKGPSAVGTDPRRFFELTWALATTDFKLRFFGSALGYLWQLLRPLLFFLVLLVLFTQVVNLGADAAYYPQALLLGVMLFTFLSDATGPAVNSLVERENLVRKIEFPRLAVPLATLLQASFNFVLNFGVVVVFLLLAGIDVRLSWLQLPLLFAALAVLAMGLAMLLSALFVWYRDVDPIWTLGLQILFYATPIFFPVQAVTGKHADLIVQLLMMNPLAAVVQQARHALVDPSHPSAAQAAGGAEYLLIPAGITLLVFVVGAQVFRRRAPRMAEEL